MAIPTSRLREIACGELEGKLFKMLQDFRATDVRGTEKATPPGGESIEEMRKRVLTWFSSFVAEAVDNALLVTHRGPLMVILDTVKPTLTRKEAFTALRHGTITILETAVSRCPRLVSIVSLREELDSDGCDS